MADAASELYGKGRELLRGSLPAQDPPAPPPVRPPDPPPPPAPARTVEIARAFPDGGGYIKSGLGLPADVVVDGKVVFAKNPDEKGTLCTGFTFAVAMKAADEQGVLKGKSLDDLKRLQKEWYINLDGDEKLDKNTERGCVRAMESLGIGRAVAHGEARQGDFVQFWRTKSGHSAVFLEYIERDGKRVGFRYRSSQGSTDGVGVTEEYFQGFAGADGKPGAVDPARTYFGRIGGK
jgi:hypothetical protein